MNGIPLINGYEYSWGDIVCNIGGVPVTGIRAIEYSDEQEVVNNYGAGRYPISRSKGRITCAAKITLTIEEVRAIKANVLNGRLQDILPFDIIVSYLPDDATKIHHDTIKNCQFNKNARTWAEGDTSQNVELDLVVSHIVWG
ncbi:MAG: hypothetical protein LBJ47_09855 [Tannerella sp.]|jgi:polyribonucleotide nucleotidyltransferase|nr:hypothetical protein [Tannerella sp.]